MTDATHPAPRPRPVALFRSPIRLVLAAGIRAAVGGLAVWTGLGIPGLLGTALIAAGSTVLVYAAILSLFFATVRLEIGPAEIQVAWALGRFRYRLRRGPLTRLAPRRRRLVDAQLSFLGLELGGAKLAGEQLAGVLALGPAPALIAIPTDAGRLALAPRTEDELLDALRAVHVV
jgi:hypothetical protein